MNSSLLVFSRHCCQEGIWTEELQIFSVLFNKYFSSLKLPVWPQPRVGKGEAEEPPSEGGVTHPGDAGGAGDRDRVVGGLQHRWHEGGPGGEPLLVQLLVLLVETSIVRSKLFSLLRARHPECLSRQYHYAKWANDHSLNKGDRPDGSSPLRRLRAATLSAQPAEVLSLPSNIYIIVPASSIRGADALTEIKVAKLPNFLTIVLLRSRKYICRCRCRLYF